MKRWAYHLFCALSLLVLAMSVTLWVRSYFFYELVEHTRHTVDTTRDPTVSENLTYDIYLLPGKLVVSRSRVDYWGPFNIPYKPWAYLRNPQYSKVNWTPAPGDWMFFKFGGLWLRCHKEVLQTRGTAKIPYGWSTTQDVALPLWAFLIFALPPVLWWWRRKHDAKGRGFDLGAGSGKSDIQSAEK